LKLNIPSFQPPCLPHTAAIASGSGTVYINGKKAAWVGSSLKGCTKVTGGSGDVFIGS
jgi:uncharacterized Zn-binding protein involved in type VI secretion